MQIADYFTRETLYQGRKFSVYRAEKAGSGSTVVLKVLDKKTIHQPFIKQGLAREYAFLSGIDSPYVIKALDWIEDNEHMVLVLEDIAGKSIKEYLKENTFTSDDFFQIALAITSGLVAIHRGNIIHKDINSHNLILVPGAKTVKIIDFDISSTFDIKVAYLGNPGNIQGTLSYISPEQTGRMNRRVDQRSDFYSLGVTFYEMLTGRLPFPYNDPMELVHAHLARLPQAPVELNKQIPLSLSQLVLKLLAKNAEDRYQSAEGLKYDLETMAALVRTKEKDGIGFCLGTRDFPGKLQIPEKLYGRDSEIEKLLGAYHAVSEGAREMIFVTGFSGTGKTSLVNEIHKPITRDRGYFISGKFDPLQRRIPYYGFIQALDQLCKLLLTEREEILSIWKERIIKAVGDLGKVLTMIIPQLETIIGQQPELVEVRGGEAERRFNYVFQRFLQAVCTKEHPLVIFIDDWQWADLASMALLNVLMEDRQNHYLLFIGAYRKNEILPTHPLPAVIESIRKLGWVVHDIPLPNLSRENAREWLEDTLKSGGKTGQEVSSLADLIYQKTGGNAFFMTHFLQELYRENWLRFDFERCIWDWDVEEIEKQDITDNVVELLVGKIHSIQLEVQEVLKLAACIGNRFDLETLSIISNKDKAWLVVNLEIALNENLLYPLEGEGYMFAHDRIHQAVYSLIANEDKKKLHLTIGRLLLKTYQYPGLVSDLVTLRDDITLHLFDMVNHLNIGIDLVEDEQEKIQYVYLNLKAGQNARGSAAYKTGAEYLQTALKLMPGDSWQRYYELTLAVYHEAIQTFYLCGNYEGMGSYIQIVLQSAVDIAHTTVAYEYQVLKLMATDKPQTAAETLLTIFSTLGVDIPRHPDNTQNMMKLNEVQGMLEKISMDALIDLPAITDQRKQLVLRLFYIGAIAFMFGTPEILLYLTSEMMALTIIYGITQETPFIVSFYGIIRLLVGDVPGAYGLGEIAMEFLEKRTNNEGVKVRAFSIASFYLLGNKLHYKKVCQLMMGYYPLAVNVGDFEYASYILSTYTHYLGRTDTDLLTWQKEVESMQEQIIQMKQSIALTAIKIEAGFVANLLGKISSKAFGTFNLEQLLQGMDDAGKMIYIFSSSVKQTMYSFLMEDYDHILQYILAVEANWAAVQIPIPYYKSDYHFYRPLAYLQVVAKTSDEKTRAGYLQKVEESIKIMKDWSDFGPVNFLHKYYLLQAEYFRVTGHTDDAEEYYDMAIEKAFENEYINEAAVANELAAKYYMHKNKRKLATLYFTEARHGYRSWGALSKVKNLEERYPKYLSTAIVDPSRMNTLASISTDSTGEFLDVKSILKASQALAGEVQLRRLLEKMMPILTENAGAQRSLLIENHNGRLVIQAEGKTGEMTETLQELPAEESGKVPLSVLHYVAHSKEKLVFENLSDAPDYSTDIYVQTHHPRSVVCFPVTSKGGLSAVIYLENNLVEGAFTPSRLEVLNMLSAQIAISVENTHLYESLEEKVRQRTTALQIAHTKLEKSHIALEEVLKKMNDSVNYASRIQTAVLPSTELMEQIFPQHFVFYQPCSVVSGDFYWLEQCDGLSVMAVADCTGHGVPGALLSMLGISILNYIVPRMTSKTQLNPGKIIDELRTRLKWSLRQGEASSEQKDGMDIVLCIIDPFNHNIHYAGAHHPLYIVRDNQLIEYKADRMPVSIHRKEFPFTNHVISYQTGDKVYLCSDGFSDQIGEGTDSKYMKKNLKKLITEINREPMSRQKEIFIHRFEEWKGNQPQIDDITIFGVQL